MWFNIVDTDLNTIHLIIIYLRTRSSDDVTGNVTKDTEWCAGLVTVIAISAPSTALNKTALCMIIMKLSSNIQNQALFIWRTNQFQKSR